MIEKRHQAGNGKIFSHVQRPEGTKLMRGCFRLFEKIPQFRRDGRVELTCVGAMLQKHTGASAIPIVAIGEQSHELEIGLRSKVESEFSRKPLGCDAPDEAGILVVNGAPANIAIVPV